MLSDGRGLFSHWICSLSSFTCQPESHLLREFAYFTLN